MDEEIQSRFEDLERRVAKLEEFCGTTTPPREKEEAEIPAADVPQIKVSKSSTENISLLFKTDWGSKPRTQDEVYKALEVNAASEDRRKIAVCLRRLTRKGELRRISKGGTYAYYKVS